jgi:hypothetical protein
MHRILATKATQEDYLKFFNKLYREPKTIAEIKAILLKKYY